MLSDVAGAVGAPGTAGWRLVVAACFGALANLPLIHIRFGHHRHSFTWLEAFVVVGLVVVPGPWLALLAPAAVVVVQLSMRRAAVKIAFNAAGLAVGIQIARWLFGLAGGHLPLAHLTARSGAALALASLGLFAWNYTTVTSAVALSQGIGIRRVGLEGLPVSALVWLGNTAVGIGFAAVSISDQRALVMLPVLLGFAFLVYRAYLSARQDADAWQQLELSSRRITRLDASELAEAVTAAAGALFRADYVEMMVVEAPGRAVAFRRGTAGLRVASDAPERLAPAFWSLVESEREVHSAVAGRATEPLQRELAELGLRTCVAVPLQSSQDCVGMLRLGFDGVVRMRGRELQVLTTFANQVATAAHNALLFGRTNDLFEEYRRVTDSLGEGVLAVDVEGRVTFANPASLRMTGRPTSAMIGMPVHEVLHGSGAGPDHVAAACPLMLPLDTGETLRSDDHLIVDARSTAVPVAYTVSPLRRGDRVVGAVIALRDMTERRALEAQLEHQAYHDAITDTPNRAMFMERLNRALQGPAAGLAVLFIDVDRFKVVNDSLGHRAGDRLLWKVADRLAVCLRPGDTLARFGGDEFTILLTGVTAETAAGVAGRIVGMLKAPFEAGGREVVLSVSIGVAAACPPGRHEAEELIHQADVAMYQAKQRGRDRYAVFQPDMADRPLERLEREVALRRGIERDEFEVHYQPIVAVGSGSVVGVEALVRWRGPEGMVAPSDFIALAEDTGLILPLGRFVLAEACGQLRRWRDDGAVDPAFTLNVNISARQFQDETLAGDIARILFDSGLPPHVLCLEITESVIMHDLPSTMATLTELSELGVRIAIDDFGTGYSSLSYLKRFPVDVVKIDGSFIEGIDDHAVDCEIVAAVVRLAGSLGMRAVAEGVETAGQLDRLRAVGCPLAQGFHFSRARTAPELGGLLAGLPTA